MEDKKSLQDTEVETAVMKQAGNNTQPETIDLLELGYMLWKHIVQILLCVVFGAVIAFSYTKFLVTKMYTATASMYVIGNQNSVIDISSLQIGTQIAEDYQELITSENLMDEVISNLKLDTTYDQLVKEVTLTNPSNTRVLKISVTDSDPQMAADIANEIAKEAKIKLPEYTKGTAPEIYNEAKVPSKASSPNTTKNTMLGALLAGVLYCGYLIFVYLMNDTFVTSDDIYKTFGVQPIAVIPKFGKKSTGAAKKGKKR